MMAKFVIQVESTAKCMRILTSEKGKDSKNPKLLDSIPWKIKPKGFDQDAKPSSDK